MAWHMMLAAAWSSGQCLPCSQVSVSVSADAEQEKQQTNRFEPAAMMPAVAVGLGCNNAPGHAQLWSMPAREG